MQTMSELNRNEVRVGPQGRFVIPASIRRAMGIVPGETLIVRAKDGQLVLEKPDRVLARLKSTFANVPSDVSLVDELISERREEARQESEE
jgi:AbrB family looped-hinge helix DNA binding protein